MPEEGIQEKELTEDECNKITASFACPDCGAKLRLLASDGPGLAKAYQCTSSDCGSTFVDRWVLGIRRVTKQPPEENQPMPEPPGDYFLITCNDDGDVRASWYGKEDVLLALEEHGLNPENALRSLEEGNPQMWKGGKFLLLKGRMVQPVKIDTPRSVIPIGSRGGYELP